MHITNFFLNTKFIFYRRANLKKEIFNRKQNYLRDLVVQNIQKKTRDQSMNYKKYVTLTNFNLNNLHYCCIQYLIFEHTHTLSLPVSLFLSPQLLHLSFTPFSTVLHVTARTLFGTWILLSRNCFRPPSERRTAVELSPSWTSKNSESHLSVLAVVSTFYFHSIG